MSSSKDKEQYQQYDRSLRFQHLQSGGELVGITILRKKRSLNMDLLDPVVKTIIKLQFMPKNVRLSFVKKMIKGIVIKLLSLSLLKKDIIFRRCLADFVAISLIVFIIRTEYLQLIKQEN